MFSVGYQQSVEELFVDAREKRRAIVSLVEELEAIDWCNQQPGASK